MDCDGERMSPHLCKGLRGGFPMEAKGFQAEISGCLLLHRDVLARDKPEGIHCRSGLLWSLELEELKAWPRAVWNEKRKQPRRSL